MAKKQSLDLQASSILRRRFLQVAAGVGLGAGAVGAFTACNSSVTKSGQASAEQFGGINQPLFQPEIIKSEAGILELTLTAGKNATVAGKASKLSGYNGVSPGPTLKVKPGDLMRITLVNNLDEPTSIHTHGLQVSPVGNSDNPFLTVEPGAQHTYEIQIPDDHPSGTTWYHPHAHGLVAQQVWEGLFGALIVEAADEPQWEDEKVIIISDISLDETGAPTKLEQVDDVMWGRLGDTVLVNGQVAPVLQTDAKLLRLHIINACVTRHLRTTENSWGGYVLGYDTHAQSAELPGGLDLASGNRIDAVLYQAAAGGRFEVLDIPRGGTSALIGDEEQLELFTVTDLAGKISNAKTDDAWHFERLEPLEDLRDAVIDNSRTLQFYMKMADANASGTNAASDSGDNSGHDHSGAVHQQMDMGFNNEVFDPQRIDISAKNGTVEQWIIQNPTSMDHPFHLHVWPMQVIDTSWGGYAGAGPHWRDVINVPAGEQAVIRVRFSGITGKSVFHCHVLDHEDAGMMGIIEVTE